MKVIEKTFILQCPPTGIDWFNRLYDLLDRGTDSSDVVLRFVITACSSSEAVVEALILQDAPEDRRLLRDHLFHLRRREFEDTSSFNAVLIVPTGIGAAIGGHAGDAGPVVKLLASICDLVITHPNVVNGSDINEIPDNALYVEGSTLSRLLLGQVALQQVRKNRVLAVIEGHKDRYFTNAAINAVNAARATYGLSCPRILEISAGMTMRASYSPSGRAAGAVTQLETMFAQLESCPSDYDAVAITSTIQIPARYDEQYFRAGGEMVNPWGGVEAMLTHAITALTNLPSAHSPMSDVQRITDPGIVDPRLAAEAISITYFQSVLKGLQRSPRILVPRQLGQPGLLDISRISCVVIPECCIGIPTLAAAVQGVPVIAVRENVNLMKNDISLVGWPPDKFFMAENYWEAAGIIAAMKSGIEAHSVRRPMSMLPDTK